MLFKTQDQIRTAANKYKTIFLENELVRSSGNMPKKTMNPRMQELIRKAQELEDFLMEPQWNPRAQDPQQFEEFKQRFNNIVDGTPRGGMLKQYTHIFYGITNLDDLSLIEDALAKLFFGDTSAADTISRALANNGIPAMLNPEREELQIGHNQQFLEEKQNKKTKKKTIISEGKVTKKKKRKQPINEDIKNDLTNDLTNDYQESKVIPNWVLNKFSKYYNEGK